MNDRHPSRWIAEHSSLKLLDSTETKSAKERHFKHDVVILRGSTSKVMEVEDTPRRRNYLIESKTLDGMVETVTR